MCDAYVVQVVDGGGDLADDGRGFFLGEAFLFGTLVERPSVHVLQYDIEMRLVVEASVHLEDIAVLETTLDPDL